MLAKGEVEEVVVRPGVDIVTIVLAEGAVIKGQRVNRRTYHMNIVDVDKFEEKIRVSEARLGIAPGRGVPIVYERNSDTAGKLLSYLIVIAVVASILSRMRGFRSPLSMDSFVRSSLPSLMHHDGRCVERSDGELFVDFHSVFFFCVCVDRRKWAGPSSRWSTRWPAADAACASPKWPASRKSNRRSSSSSTT